MYLRCSTEEASNALRLEPDVLPLSYLQVLAATCYPYKITFSVLAPTRDTYKCIVRVQQNIDFNKYCASKLFLALCLYSNHNHQ